MKESIYKEWLDVLHVLIERHRRRAEREEERAFIREEEEVCT
jgi:hypothetical protein